MASTMLRSSVPLLVSKNSELHYQILRTLIGFGTCACVNTKTSYIALCIDSFRRPLILFDSSEKCPLNVPNRCHSTFLELQQNEIFSIIERNYRFSRFVAKFFWVHDDISLRPVQNLSFSTFLSGYLRHH